MYRRKGGGCPGLQGRGESEGRAEKERIERMRRGRQEEEREEGTEGSVGPVDYVCTT